MVRLRSVGVLSCAKVFAILHAAIGVLVALLVVLVGVVGLAAAPAQQKLGMVGLLIMAAMMPFLYAGLGFLFGGLWALIYNWSASAIGGIEMELEAVPVAFVPAQESAANPLP
jgi:hypothetical protein